MPTVPLTTIQAVKDQPVTYQPLLLARVVFTTTEAEKTITGASNTTPIAIIASGHGYQTGDVVTVAGVGGLTAANGRWVVTRIDADSFSLDGSSGNAPRTSGGYVMKHKVLRLATHGLRTVDGGFQYDGQDWLPRILNQDIAATQALSEQGIDFTPSVTLKIADPDKYVWLNYAQPYGFKGATLELFFVFWEVDTSNFSSDRKTCFIGLCGELSDGDEESCSVTAVSKMNMSSINLPSIRIQKRCPWIFPVTKEQRQDGADNEDSLHYECGYSPDATGSNARGNNDSGTPFTSCNYTKEDCVARGMYTKDSADRTTGRFGGVQWAPPQSFKSKSFLNNKWEEITNTSNEGKYGDLVPLVYGKQRVEPLILNMTGDANQTKMEVLLCWGQVSYIWEVLVNDVRISHAQNDGVMIPGEGGDPVKGFWKFVNQGDRDGSPCTDTLYDGKGDPYGSLSVIEIVVPRKLADSASIPRVEVYLQGGPIRQYRDIVSLSVSGGVATVTFAQPNYDISSNDPNFEVEISGCSYGAANGRWKPLTNWVYGPPGQVSFTCPVANGSGTGGVFGWKHTSTNPVWILLDMLTWAGWRYAEVDLASFIKAADKCDELIDYKNQFNVTKQHARFKGSITLRQRRSVSDVVRNFRNVFRGLVLPNYSSGGKLQILIKETLASQQPTADSNSNNTSPIASHLVDGTDANGYLKYDFDDRHYLEKNGRSTFKISTRQDQAANKISTQFQNEDNWHVFESLTVIDSEDAARMGQEYPGSMSLEGIVNFDQLYRVGNTMLAEGYRGNNRTAIDGSAIGDTGGTIYCEFETTFRVVHLRVGDICRVSSQAWGITNQLVRIMKIQPQTNFENVRITAAFHNDAWYLDTFGQSGSPRFRPSYRNRLERPSFPWSPYGQQPLSGDAWLSTEEWSFKLSPSNETLADGSALGRLEVSGRLPVNMFPSEPEPPYMDQQGTTATTGGTLTGGQTYFLAVCAKNVAGSGYKLSAPSRVCTIYVPAGTSTNTVTMTGLVWGTGAAGYVLFAGTDPNKLTYQSDGDTTPSSITLTSLKASTWGMPDSEFDRLRFRVKRVMHSGVWGAGVVSCTSNTIKVGVLAGANAGFTTNQWANYDLVLLAMQGETGPLPIVNWTVTANDRDTLTVTGPDPSAIVRPSGEVGLQANDVVVLRSKPTIGSDATGNYVEDAGWINNLCPLLEAYSITNATNANPIVVTTAVNHPYATGDKVYVQGVAGNSAANDLWTITKVSATQFSLDGSTGNGAYSGGGQAQQMTIGLVNDQERGRILRFVHGPGKGSFVKIKSNTQVSGPAERIYIEGAWPVTPTSASRFIIEEPSWQIITDTESFNNETYGTEVSSTINVDNYKNQTLLVQVLTLDGGDSESAEHLSPVREIWNIGAAGSIGFTGAVYMNIDGNLAIGSDLAPPVFLAKDTRAVSVRAEAKNAPTGANLVIEIYLGSTLWMTLTMLAGTTYIEATANQISSAATLTADTDIKLNITAVGTTNPGADLAVIIYV